MAQMRVRWEWSVAHGAWMMEVTNFKEVWPNAPSGSETAAIVREDRGTGKWYATYWGQCCSANKGELNGFDTLEELKQVLPAVIRLDS